MERTLTKETVNKIGQKVHVMGWIDRLRDHGGVLFFDLWDRSGILQVVVKEIKGELHPQDVVSIMGEVKKRPAGTENKELSTGEVEIEAQEVEVISKAETLPFDMGGPDLNLELPTLLDWRALTLRHPKIASIFEVQEVVIDAFRKTLKDLGFAEFQAPIIVPATAEGGAEVFPVKYFEHTAYLGQSPQLYKQIMLGVFERVFTVTHAFRAEPSVTTRHLTEYISLDAEMSFIKSWEEIMDTVEHVVHKIINAVDTHCSEQLKMYNTTIPTAPQNFPRIKLKEAHDIIYKRTGRDNRSEPDLSPIDEEEICRWAKEEKGSDFVFITHYPVKKRPFYTYPDPHDKEFTLSFDLLGRGLEWVTGGQRLNDYKELIENIKRWGNNPKDFELYLQAFRFGMPPEGGFAMGAERVTMKILGLANIREASLFPRDMERVDIRLSSQKSKVKSKNGKKD